MLPRFSSVPSHRISKAGLARQARVAGTHSQQQKQARSVAASRLPTVQASCRLVLRPTGNGSYDHIGEETPLPKPILLKEGVFEVGRVSPADIQIPLPTVSSRHALLRVEENQVHITDLNSTNGTLVNGQELLPMDDITIGIGAEVVFGDMYLAKFQLDEVPDHLAQEQLEQLQQQQAAAAAAAAELSDQLSGPEHPNNSTISS